MNWAKLQEDLVGLPVSKRARHGIHFDKGNGEVLAHFSGKPCHYEDGGIWKPIDTRLLATSGGFYGSPHSDVKIHPDGRVVVDKSDYQQFTKLPSAKAGKLSGDRIIRTFPGGEQHLIMTEDGFREEIHIEKPTFPLEKFIAKTTGNLPSKYKAHPVTAEDAAGNTYEFTGDVAAFGKWLEAAKYPVVIDPDFAGDAADGYITSYAKTTYAASRTTSASYDSTSVNLPTGQRKNSSSAWGIYRSFIKFNTSTIGAGSTVAQVNLKLAADTDTSTSADFDVQIAKYDWSGQDPLSNDNREAAFDGCLAADSDDSIWRNTSGMSVDTVYTSGNLSTAWVSKTGNTYYGLRSNRDYANTEATGNEWCNIASVNHTTEGLRPVLTVTYTSAGGGMLFTNMFGNMQNLAGGMNG